MPKKRRSKYADEYNRNRKRIQAAIRRLEKRGYLLPEDILPPKPSKITKRELRRLEKINLESIYAKATYVDPSTGEFERGKESRRLERQTRKESKYPDFNTIVIDRFLEHVDSTFQPRFRSYIKVWLKKLRHQYGDQQAARVLEEGAQSALWPSYESVSDLDLVLSKLAAMLDYMDGYGGNELDRQLMQDALEEEAEEWTLVEDDEIPFGE